VSTWSYLELLSSSHLSLLTQVFNLGLSKNNVRVRGWILVNIGLLDDEQNILRLSDCDTVDSSDLKQRTGSFIIFVLENPKNYFSTAHLLEPQLGHNLPCLLLSTALLDFAHQIIIPESL
jgi:hypothetical protein